MTTPSGSGADRYALVSSFYGPGVVGSWYLTYLGCFVSQTLHRRKHRVDSITADLVAVAAFPCIAAGHLLAQIHSYPMPREDIGLMATQRAASIEASLRITEAFMILDFILTAMAVKFACLKRTCFLAAVGLFCLSSMFVLIYSEEWEHMIEPRFERGVIISLSNGHRLTVMLKLLSLFAWVTIDFPAVFFWLVERCGPHGKAPIEATAINTNQNPVRPETTWRSRILDAVESDRIFVPLTFVVLLLPPILISCGTIWVVPRIFIGSGDVMLGFSRFLFPKSKFSVKELDQAAALTAGACGLGFSFYSTARSLLRPSEH